MSNRYERPEIVKEICAVSMMTGMMMMMASCYHALLLNILELELLFSYNKYEIIDRKKCCIYYGVSRYVVFSDGNKI